MSNFTVIVAYKCQQLPILPGAGSIWVLEKHGVTCILTVLLLSYCSNQVRRTWIHRLQQNPSQASVASHKVRNVNNFIQYSKRRFDKWTKFSCDTIIPDISRERFFVEMMQLKFEILSATKDSPWLTCFRVGLTGWRYIRPDQSTNQLCWTWCSSQLWIYSLPLTIQADGHHKNHHRRR